MSLARAWRRQLYGASGAALIVPCAMLAALVVLALGGSFSGVGVLGQIFAGPAAPGLGEGAVAGGHAGGAAHGLPGIPVAALGLVGPGSGHRGVVGGGRRGGAPVSSGGTGHGGGAVVGGVAPIVATRPVSPVRPAPASPSPGSPAPTRSAPPPSPTPSPKPTPVDTIVNTATPVTEQLPGPVGPAATQAVQTAGSAADSVLPPSSNVPAPPALPGVKIP